MSDWEIAMRRGSMFQTCSGLRQNTRKLPPSGGSLDHDHPTNLGPTKNPNDYFAEFDAALSANRGTKTDTATTRFFSRQHVSNVLGIAPEHQEAAAIPSTFETC